MNFHLHLHDSPATVPAATVGPAIVGGPLGGGLFLKLLQAAPAIIALVKSLIAEFSSPPTPSAGVDPPAA